MKEIAATEVKSSFGQVLELTRSEPVAIEKDGEMVAVIMSFAEYQRLTELEDRYWGRRAEQALEHGFVAEEDGNTWLKEALAL